MVRFEHAEGIKQETRRIEKFDPQFLGLWTKLGLPGKPPAQGSVAEGRLRETCERYTQYVINPEMMKHAGSDQRRRNLHNEIAIMLVGRPRSGMDGVEADKIANFAVQLSTGYSLKEAEVQVSSEKTYA